jgi:quercetin dioxygenase-like cupin family protein
MKSAFTRATIASALLTICAASSAVGPGTQLRLTPQEILAIGHSGASQGTSGVSGIQTRVLKGDPGKAGLYTIQLTVPPDTTIQAHDHPDDRMATVVAGMWYFGYGEEFDEKQLKALSPGSFYVESPREPHFARTGQAGAVLHISGFGPSGTKYVAH